MYAQKSNQVRKDHPRAEVEESPTRASPSPISRHLVAAFLLGESASDHIASLLRCHFREAEVQRLLASYRAGAPLGAKILQDGGEPARSLLPRQIMHDVRFRWQAEGQASSAPQAPSPPVQTTQQFAIVPPTGTDTTLILGGKIIYRIQPTKQALLPAYRAEVNSPDWLLPFVNRKTSYRFFWSVRHEQGSRQPDAAEEQASEWTFRPERIGIYHIFCRVELRIENQWQFLEKVTFDQPVATAAGEAERMFPALSLPDRRRFVDQPTNRKVSAPAPSRIQSAQPATLALRGKYVQQTYRVKPETKNSRRTSAPLHAWYLVPDGKAPAIFKSKRYQAWQQVSLPETFGRFSGKTAFDLGVGSEATFHFGDLGGYTVIAASTDDDTNLRPTARTKPYDAFRQQVISQETVRINELSKSAFRLLPEEPIAFFPPRAPTPLRNPDTDQPYHIQVDRLPPASKHRANYGWYVLCDRWDLMAETNAGFRKVTIPADFGLFAGQPAYDIPSGCDALLANTRFLWPFRQANRYLVLCVELNLGGKPQLDREGNLYRFCTKTVQVFGPDDPDARLHRLRLEYNRELSVTKELFRRLDPATIVPIKALHVDRASSRKTQLELFYGKFKDGAPRDANGPGMLLDITGGHKRREFPGPTLDETLQNLCEHLGDGAVRIEADHNGKKRAQTFTTYKRWDEFADSASDLALAAGLASLATLTLPVAVPTALARIAMYAALTAGTVQTVEHFLEAELNGTTLAADLSVLVSAVFLSSLMRAKGGMLKEGAKALHIRGKVALYTVIAMDVGRSYLIAAEVLVQIEAIENSQLTPAEKRHAIADILRNAALQGGMVVLRYVIPPVAARARHEKAQRFRASEKPGGLAQPRKQPRRDGGQSSTGDRRAGRQSTDIEMTYNSVTQQWEAVIPTAQAPPPPPARPSSAQAVPPKPAPPALAPPPQAPLLLPPAPANAPNLPIAAAAMPYHGEPEADWPTLIASDVPEPEPPSNPGPVLVHPNLTRLQRQIVDDARMAHAALNGRPSIGMDHQELLPKEGLRDQLRILRAQFEVLKLVQRGAPIADLLAIRAGIDPRKFGYWQPAPFPDGSVQDWIYNQKLGLAENQHGVTVRLQEISRQLRQNDRKIAHYTAAFNQHDARLQAATRRVPPLQAEIDRWSRKRAQVESERQLLQEEQAALHEEQQRLASWLHQTPLTTPPRTLKQEASLEVWISDLGRIGALASHHDMPPQERAIDFLQANLPDSYAWLLERRIHSLLHRQWMAAGQFEDEFARVVHQLHQDAEQLRQDSTTNRGDFIGPDERVEVSLQGELPGLRTLLTRAIRAENQRITFGEVAREAYANGFRVRLTVNPTNGQVQATVVRNH